MDTRLPDTRNSRRRATGWFWGLLAVAVLLVGGLSRAMVTPASPLTGLAVAVTSTLAVLVLTQATRLMLALTGHRRARRTRSGVGAEIES